MEFVYDFTDEMIKTIILNAMKEGYIIRCTGWFDSWERDQGCPSEIYEINPTHNNPECFINADGELSFDLPTYPRGGCREWNFIKDNEYIVFFHTEKDDTYINQESIDAFYTK